MLLLCLLSHRATSQLYQLSTGDVVRGSLIGIDTATYRSTRQYVAAAGQLLNVRASRIALLERDAWLVDSVRTAYDAELRRCRATATANEADFQKLATTTRMALGKPPAPLLLLDPHFYQGTLAGAGVLALLKLLIFH
jgi:hypothetical protein